MRVCNADELWLDCRVATGVRCIVANFQSCFGTEPRCLWLWIKGAPTIWMYARVVRMEQK